MNTNHILSHTSKIQFKLYGILFLVFGLIGFTGCDQTDPVPEEIPETVTTVKLTFTPSGGGSPVVAQAKDADGDGPGGPVVDEITLVAHTTYALSVELYNELLDPTDAGYNISDEVDNESDEHQFFFQVAPPALFDGSFQYNDQDTNGLPVGLKTTWVTGAAGSGTFRVILKHQPGLKSATSDVTVGESDVNQSFGITIP